MHKHGTNGRARRWRGWFLGPLVALTAATFATSARAENLMAKFIRIDPEPTTDEKKGTPVIPMIVELGQPTPINSFAEGCFAGGTGNKVTQEGLRCMSNKIQSTGYVKQFEFEKDKAQILSIVGGEPKPMDVVDAFPLKDATAPNAGVAWLILMDASSSIGSRWPEMQETAEAIVKSMGEHDAVQVRVMDDKSVRASTKWLSSGSKQQAVNVIRSIGATFKSGASVDSLISRIEKETIGGFQALFKDGVVGADEGVMPLIQSVVILSDGGDTSAQGFGGGAKAQVIHEKLVKGDLGIADMKLPIPVVSIWFPTNNFTGILEATKRENEYQWMSNMATPEVGGYFDVVLDGETGKGTKIAKVVRQRFDNMYYVEAKASCLDTSGEQTFKLLYGEQGTKAKIVPDTWKNVPIAFVPMKWLLDVDKKRTEEAAAKNPLAPGGTFEVYGEFCWGTNAGAAEAYIVTEADAAEVKKASADQSGKKAKELLQSLKAKKQQAETIQVGPLSAKFKVPDNPSLFENKPDSFSLNVVLLDTKSLRVSARDKSQVLVLRAQKAPVNKLIIVGAIGGGVVLILLIAILARSGGGGGRSRRRSGGAPPGPAPMPGQPPPPAPGGAPAAGPALLPAPPTALAPAPAPAAAAFVPPANVVPQTAFAPPQNLGAFAPPQAAPPAAQTAFVPPQAAPPAAQTAFVPPQAAPPAAQTAFVPPQAAPQAPFNAPQTAFAPPQATAFVPPTPLAAQQPQGPAPQTAFAPPPDASFKPAAANPTRTPTPGAGFKSGPPPPMGAPAAPKGLHELHKGATSFPTTCPNPACHRTVLVPPGGTAQCAFCGALVDASGAAVAPLPPQSSFGLTGAASESAAAMAVAAAAAAPKPIGGGTVALQANPGGEITSVSLVGAAGTFRVLAGIESRVGRDGSLCSIPLNDPRVSGVHATLKVEAGALLVRDDRSHNGTYVNGNRIPAGTWTPVPGGSQVRFGPIEFVVRHES